MGPCLDSIKIPMWIFFGSLHGTGGSNSQSVCYLQHFKVPIEPKQREARRMARARKMASSSSKIRITTDGSSPGVQTGGSNSQSVWYLQHLKVANSSSKRESRRTAAWAAAGRAAGRAAARPPPVEAYGGLFDTTIRTL